MAQRLELQALLEELLGSDNVYFQPPDNITIVYPCIVYNRNAEDSTFADNLKYKYKRRYQVTHISRNPDSEVVEKLSALPLCTYNRFYAVDNLNHDVFNLFF